jgi:hypothetical protein
MDDVITRGVLPNRHEDALAPARLPTTQRDILDEPHRQADTVPIAAPQVVEVAARSA